MGKKQSRANRPIQSPAQQTCYSLFPSHWAKHTVPKTPGQELLSTSNYSIILQHSLLTNTKQSELIQASLVLRFDWRADGSVTYKTFHNKEKRKTLCGVTIEWKLSYFPNMTSWWNRTCGNIFVRREIRTKKCKSLQFPIELSTEWC